MFSGNKLSQTTYKEVADRGTEIPNESAQHATFTVELRSKTEINYVRIKRSAVLQPNELKKIKTERVDSFA